MDTDTTHNTDPTADHTCSPACNYCNVPTPAYTPSNGDGWKDRPPTRRTPEMATAAEHQTRAEAAADRTAAAASQEYPA